MLTTTIDTPIGAILDDDPSVVARGSAASAALLSVKRHWVLAEGLPLEGGARLAPVEVAYEAGGR